MLYGSLALSLSHARPSVRSLVATGRSARLVKTRVGSNCTAKRGAACQKIACLEPFTRFPCGLSTFLVSVDALSCLLHSLVFLHLTGRPPTNKHASFVDGVRPTGVPHCAQRSSRRSVANVLFFTRRVAFLRLRALGSPSCNNNNKQGCC